MPLLPARCTQCNAELQVDSSLDAAVCKYCGTPFIVEKAINNYNTYVTQNFAGANVTVLGKESVDDMCALADRYLQKGAYEVAYEHYTKIKEEYPSDYRGPLGCIVSITNNYSKLPKFTPIQVEEFRKDREKINVLAPADVSEDVIKRTRRLIKDRDAENLKRRDSTDTWMYICPKCEDTYSSENKDDRSICPSCRKRVMALNYSKYGWNLLLDAEKESAKRSRIDSQPRGLFGGLF